MLAKIGVTRRTGSLSTAMLSGLEIVQLGRGLAAAVCGRLFADAGSSVVAVDPSLSSPLAIHLNGGKRIVCRDRAAMNLALAAANVIVCEGRPSELQARREDPDALRRINPTAAIVAISPFGLSGPNADEPAADLTLFFASGIARMLTGQADDLDEPPLRPAGEQSAFIGGIAAACAGMHAILGQAAQRQGAVIDVSLQEALATLAITELARAGRTGQTWSRRRVADANGATVCILPSRDGYVAISPRDDHQWAAWLGVMGSPDWGADPRFARKPHRIANWDALYTLMSTWSRQHDKQVIADKAQAAHVPSFPLREPIEQLASPQLAHRGFFRRADIGGRTIEVPTSPFGVTIMPGVQRGLETPSAATMPLAGVRVLDFSWVIAGPTATRYLAAMGADVVKVEAPGRGDPGRASELHTVLGQAKRSIVLDLKKPQAVELARQLAAKSDVLIENFATGVMERLGLGAATLEEINPRLIYVSASGLGRSGPEAQAVAYGTLLQCYAGFAELNRHPGAPPRVGLAWLDPMCGLMLAFITAAALWQRHHHGNVARVDFSMLEAMLWTMAGPLIDAQLGAVPKPLGNRSGDYAPHGAYRCSGDDDWLSIAVTDDAQWRQLCDAVPDLSALGGLARTERMAQSEAIDCALSAWTRPQAATAAAATLVHVGIPAAALSSSVDLVRCEHLRKRGFWNTDGTGVLPGLPWRASFGRLSGDAPALGTDTEAVLLNVLGLSPATINELRDAGAFG